MKFNIRFYFPIMALSLVTLTSSVNAQTIFASWDTWADSTIVDGLDADFSLADVTATITGSALRDIRTDRQSNDGTFGTLAGASNATDAALRMLKPDGISIELNITNDSAETLSFGQLHLDAALTGDSVRTLSVVFVTGTPDEPGTESPELGNGEFETEITGGDGFIQDYDDIDIDVSSISLAAGETGFFRITFAGSTNPNNPGNPNSSSTVDNIALSEGGPTFPAITDCEFDPEASTITMTWTAMPGVSYFAELSNDLVDFETQIGTGITTDDDENPTDENQITQTFDLTDTPNEGASKLFFRVGIE